MDNHKECPPNLVDEDWQTSLEETKDVIRHIRSLPGNVPPLVHPILSPRFAISCTKELLCALGDYAQKDKTLRIETHYAENKAEVERTKELFHSKYYAEVYARFHLLRPGTILGHGVHVTEHELEIIKEKGAGIAHCPSSNFFLRSGFAPIGHYLDKKVKVCTSKQSPYPL
jgi:guanine deaminase